jgi:hypothetical protein
MKRFLGEMALWGLAGLAIGYIMSEVENKLTRKDVQVVQRPKPVVGPSPDREAWPLPFDWDFEWKVRAVIFAIPLAICLTAIWWQTTYPPSDYRPLFAIAVVSGGVANSVIWLSLLGKRWASSDCW